MFENVAVGDLLTVLRAHDFDPHDDVMGADRIDAIRGCDLVIRAAQAEQARQIAALDRLRASQLTLGRGDHSLSVIGELGMARNISPSAAGNQYGFAVGLARMPKVAEVFAKGGSRSWRPVWWCANRLASTSTRWNSLTTVSSAGFAG